MGSEMCIRDSVWDAVAGGAPLLKLEGHTDWVFAVACHDAGDGWRIVSGGHDKVLLVWDAVKGGAPLLKLEGHTDFVNAVACHDTGAGWRYVSGSDDGTVRVWDGAAGGAPLLTLEGHTKGVNAVACHGAGDGWRIVSGSDDGTVRVWDGAADAVYPLGSYVASVALAPRAGEVGVFASVGASFARLALRDGPSQLEARVEEERARSAV